MMGCDEQEYGRPNGAAPRGQARDATGQPSPYSDPLRPRKISAHPPQSPIDRAWKHIDPDLLVTPPAARRWLLRHPSKYETATRTHLGDGLLPLGKAGSVIADGGVGKTYVIVSLGVCVITGRPWLGHYEIGAEARGGRVLLALAEEDPEEVHRRLYTVAAALELSSEERALVARQLVVLALAGESVALVAPGPDRRIVETRELVTLRRRLREDAGDGWVLVGCDPFARLAEGDIEASNDGATRAVQAIESLCQAPGHPTVLAAHHASQAGVQAGAPTSRGVTGIRNAFRWEGTLRADGQDVMFRQTKSNYSVPMTEELRLVRGPGGSLRAATEADFEARAADQQDRRDVALDRNVARIVAALMKHGPSRSKAQAIEWAGLGSVPGRLALSESVTRGLVDEGGTDRRPVWCARAAPHTPESASPRTERETQDTRVADSVREESARVRESAKHWTEENDHA